MDKRRFVPFSIKVWFHIKFIAIALKCWSQWNLAIINTHVITTQYKIRPFPLPDLLSITEMSFAYSGTSCRYNCIVWTLCTWPPSLNLVFLRYTFGIVFTYCKGVVVGLGFSFLVFGFRWGGLVVVGGGGVVSQAGLKLVMVLPQPPKVLGLQANPPYPTFFFAFAE